MGGDSRYSDTSFKREDAIFFHDGGFNEINSNLARHQRNGLIQWSRLNDFVNEPSLFGSEGIRPEDVQQGLIGNCWFMASIAAYAEYPGRVESLFLNKQASQNGLYAVNLWALNVPVTIMVDDDVPLRSVGDQLGAWFAKIGDDGSLWGPIIEKALAKLYGNYARIEFGDTIHGVTVLNGSPYIRHFHEDMDIDQLWELISKFDKEEHRGLIIGNTPGESADEKNEFGLN